jgi:hypothetical protein
MLQRSSQPAGWRANNQSISIFDLLTTMTDREAFNEFARGAAFVIVVMGVFVLFIATLDHFGSEPEPKFKVVDHYKQCDVVRYTDDTQRWHYFLDCRRVKSSEPFYENNQ